MMFAFRSSRRLLIRSSVAVVLLLAASTYIWSSRILGSSHPGTPLRYRYLQERSLDLDLETDSSFSNSSDFHNSHITWPNNKYKTYVGRGCRLWDMLKRNIEPPTSSFSEISELQNSGWTTPDESPETTNERLRQLLGSISDPLKDKGLGITVNDGWCNIETTHSDTQAKYFELYNPKKGVIVAYRNYGPDYMIKNYDGSKGKSSPKLNRWSDVVYLVWTSVTSILERMNLRYIIRLNVQNEDTNEIVSEALKRAGGKRDGIPPAWPGFVLKPEGETRESFTAVLGTPNVYGIAYMLLQHSGNLGRKTIRSITVWDKSGMANQDAGWQLCIMVEVGEFLG